MRALAFIVGVALLPVACSAGAEQEPSRPASTDRDLAHDRANAQGNDVNGAIDQWPAGPQLAAQEMMAKYGPPKEVTSERLIWHDAGPFARVMVTRQELPHNFPITHKDYLEHTIYYTVPADKTDEVHAFDASITIHPGSGELSARCDLESNNVLTLNLANDIVKNGKSVAAARKEFGQAVTDRTLGKPPASTQALQFKPAAPGTSATLESVTVAGSPEPAGGDPRPGGTDRSGSTSATRGGPDAEVMALLIALHENEVHAAMAAEQEEGLAKPVLDYATMLHREHGKGIADTQQLGMKIGVTPVESPAADAMHAEGATMLAQLVPKDGDDFARSFADAMAKGHRDALQKVDEWQGRAMHPELKQHLTTARQSIESHMKQAEGLQTRTNR